VSAVLGWIIVAALIVAAWSIARAIVATHHLQRATKHRRTDPACRLHHGRTPARSRGKSCPVCMPARRPASESVLVGWRCEDCTARNAPASPAAAVAGARLHRASWPGHRIMTWPVPR